HEEGSNTLRINPHRIPFDYVFTKHGSTWTDITAQFAAAGSVALTNANGDKHYFGMKKSRFQRIRLDFSIIPIGGTHGYKYSQGGGVFASATVTALTGNNNWTGSSIYEGEITIPTDWAQDDTIGGGDDALPVVEDAYWIEVTATSGYSTQGVGRFANTK